MDRIEAAARALCTADDGGDADLIWEATIHSGDCTNECHTCSVCQREHYEELARAALAAADQAAPQGWQPIEMAPKDGTKVLVYCPPGIAGGVRVDAWLACLADGSGELSDAWYCSSFSNQPTHWMPLPAPPQP
jgi:uncharacterized protein DUF551